MVFVVESTSPIALDINQLDYFSIEIHNNSINNKPVRSTTALLAPRRRTIH